jgi:hypothetical protein
VTTTPPAPTVTVSTDANPCPRVEILVSPMPVDADTITVTRFYGSQADTVRGATGAVVAGDFVVIDYEVPLGVAVSYACVTKDSGGVPSSVSTASDAVTLDVAEVWAQDPLDPSTSMPWASSRTGGVDAFLRKGSLTGYTLGANQALAPSIGSRRPVGQSGVRQAPSAIPILLTTTSDDTAQALYALLVQAGAALCLRVPPSAVKLYDALSYVQLGDIVPDTTREGQIWWTTSGTQIVGPSLDVIVPVRNYEDLAGEAATYADLAVLYATYLDMQRGI